MNDGLAWIILILAGIFEVGWAYFLKQSDGLSKFTAAFFFFITLILSMVLLALSLKKIPISLAYPVWTGIGAVGSVIVGIVCFGESLGLLRAIFVGLVLAGIIGLKAVSSH